MCGPPPPSSSHRWGSAKRSPAGVSVTVAPDVIVRGTRAAPGPSQPARVAGCLTGWGPWAFFAVPDRPRVSCAPRGAGAHDTRGRSGTAKNAHGPHPVRQPATRAGWEGPGAARVPRTITSGATVTDTPAGERFADPQRWEDEGGGGTDIWGTPGLHSATGWVVRRTRRVVFCAADLQDVAGRLLASSRCTQVVRADDWGAGRYGAADPAGAPPRDARG